MEARLTKEIKNRIISRPSTSFSEPLLIELNKNQSDSYLCVERMDASEPELGWHF